jgi:hypothetical protein
MPRVAPPSRQQLKQLHASIAAAESLPLQEAVAACEAAGISAATALKVRVRRARRLLPGTPACHGPAEPPTHCDPSGRSGCRARPRHWRCGAASQVASGIAGAQVELCPRELLVLLLAMTGSNLASTVQGIFDLFGSGGQLACGEFLALFSHLAQRDPELGAATVRRCQGPCADRVRGGMRVVCGWVLGGRGGAGKSGPGQ